MIEINFQQSNWFKQFSATVIKIPKYKKNHLYCPPKNVVKKNVKLIITFSTWKTKDICMIRHWNRNNGYLIVFHNIKASNQFWTYCLESNQIHRLTKVKKDNHYENVLMHLIIRNIWRLLWWWRLQVHGLSKILF